MRRSCDRGIAWDDPALGIDWRLPSSEVIVSERIGSSRVLPMPSGLFNSYVEGDVGMRVLVTGGAGFIGSAVCRHFIADLRYEVVVLDKMTYAGNLASLAPVASSSGYTLRKA